MIYATDEDIAIRAPEDYALLCPGDQRVVFGSDGAFDLLDPWLLTSASANLAGSGLVPGQIVLLVGPSPAFHEPGEAFAVDSVSAQGVRLRRKGQSAGSGLPPSTTPGLNNVSFLALTLSPQIARASEEVDRCFGIDASFPGRDPATLLDTRILRDATVLTVLRQRYRDLGYAGNAKLDSWHARTGQMAAELDSLLTKAILHWPLAIAPGNPRLSTRLSR